VDEEVIPVLYVEDAARAVAWYERLGFKKEWEHRFEPGLPFSFQWREDVFVSISLNTKGTHGPTRSFT
jgi:hypothetical protein